MFKIIEGDAFEKLNSIKEKSVDVCFTSPGPPGSEPLGHAGGFNKPEYYVFNLASIFDKVKRVLKDTGSLWVQMGDYHDDTGSLKLTPERFVLSMREHGWIVRSKVIWHRDSETHRDDHSRFQRDWEYLYWFVKPYSKYYYDDKVKMAPYLSWSIFDNAVYSFIPEVIRPGEFMTIFPPDLVRLALLSTCPKGGLVLDPFSDSGTTGLVALKHGYRYIGIEMDGEKVMKQLARLTSNA